MAYEAESGCWSLGYWVPAEKPPWDADLAPWNSSQTSGTRWFLWRRQCDQPYLGLRWGLIKDKFIEQTSPLLLSPTGLSVCLSLSLSLTDRDTLQLPNLFRENELLSFADQPESQTTPGTAMSRSLLSHSPCSAAHQGTSLPLHRVFPNRLTVSSFLNMQFI